MEQYYWEMTKELYQEFNYIADKILENHFKGHIKSAPRLYHYTSVESARNIIENGTLRFSNIRYLNDPSELQCGLEILDKALPEIPVQTSENKILFCAHEFLRFIFANVKLNLSLHNQKKGNVEDCKLVSEFISTQMPEDHGRIVRHI